jgi:hypothetical protein
LTLVLCAATLARGVPRSAVQIEQEDSRT